MLFCLDNSGEVGVIHEDRDGGLVEVLILL